MGTHVWEFRLSIQVCVWVLTFSIHIQVVRFRYSDSGIQVWNSDLGIQDWVYRLADKYKEISFSIHIQGIQVYNAGLGVQTCLYTKALTVFTFRVFRFMYSHSGIQVWVYRLGYTGKSVHPNLNCKPEYPECEYCECFGIQASLLLRPITPM